ncbi:putative nucleotide-diphospho-sugar transferase [Duncaniella muris]|uniref:putative nucleotide-diphospho-sugar transferase n=1 Tax=Duncaniella muris TaxID=2094150 RepID=UPI00272E3BA8|nr:putative nucleotide-diphospho-sugar transferase [Duncaniella muris]
MTAVYILISNGDDLFYEQLLVSLYSLRMHNPKLNVVVLVDEKTERTLHGKRSKVRELANEIKIVEVPEEYNSKERSRYIKTTFRNYLSGNLLFIDTDTVITDNLRDVENTNADMACVLDFHCLLSQREDKLHFGERMKRVFDIDVSEILHYFNSGVIFIRDTPAVYQFFEDWHNYWLFSAFQKNENYDQPAFLMADLKNAHFIKELGGEYNCQLLTSIEYLHTAKILHFFNINWPGKERFSPFFRNDLYEELKQTGEISENTHNLIINCKSAFYSPMLFADPRESEFTSTLVGTTLYLSFLRSGWLYKLVDSLFKFIKNVKHALKRIR